MVGDSPRCVPIVRAKRLTLLGRVGRYANNDTDNNKYWSNNAPPPGGHGDNGWQRGQNGYY
jgi:hypothetical protein